MGGLSQTEINAVLNKIRAKYDLLFRTYKKSSVLSEMFNERYNDAVKKRFDMMAFLKAEIEVVDEMIKKEEEKKIEDDKRKEEEKIQEKKRSEIELSIAEQLQQEYRQKILRYPSAQMSVELDEELDHFIGAMRDFLNSYLPALTYMYKEKTHTLEGETLNMLYDKIVVQYDYKEDAPIARSLITAYKHNDPKRMDMERSFIMKETAFLFNELMDELQGVWEKGNIPFPTNRIVLPKLLSQDSKFNKIFDNRIFKDAFTIVFEQLKQIIADFRIKDIKRKIG
jgi:hypothetical protein